MRRPKLFDLNDALQHPGRKVSLKVSTSLEEEDDLDLVRPIVGELEAVSTGRVLLVEGLCHVTMVLECARCNVPVEVEFDMDIHEEFPVEGVAAGYGSGGMAHVVPGEDAVMFRGNSLIWEELIRQDLWGQIPFSVLCREDCPGVDWGNGAPSGRPEFQVLSQLLDSAEDEKSE
jgi:uncharacterized protein